MAADKSRFCTQCGERAEAHAFHCIACGARLSAAEEPRPRLCIAVTKRARITALLLLVSCAILVAYYVGFGAREEGRFAPDVAASDGLDRLKQYTVFVYGTGRGFCDVLRDNGFKVRCSEDDTYNRNQIILHCPELPDNAGDLLKAFLKRPDLEVFDWRNDPMSAAICSSHSAITLIITGRPSPDSPTP
jgi:hypothetical protein